MSHDLAKKPTFVAPIHVLEVGMAKENLNGVDAKDAASLQTVNIKVLDDDENFDNSMMLAIGSTFKCKCTVKSDGTAVMHADSTVLYKRSVVSLMEGIRGLLVFSAISDGTKS